MDSGERRRVGLIYDKRMKKHFDLEEVKHPESADRIQKIWNKLKDSGIAKRYFFISFAFYIIIDNKDFFF